MSVCEFCFPAHIHYFELWIEWQVHRKFIRINIHDDVDGFTGIFPGFKTTFQKTTHLCKTNTGEPYHRFFFFSGSGDQYEWFIEGKQTARPICKTAIETDINRSGHKSFSKFI